MRFGLSTAAALVMGLAVSGAEAMPLAPLATGPADGITLVRDGCGPYAHRSHFGYCKPNGPDEDGYGPPHFFGGPGFGGPGPDYGYEGPRCYIRETYYGPRRICHY